MVYSMITGDMLTFGIIYMVVLFGFCQSFYFLYKGFPGVKSSLYGSYHSTWMALFQITLGDYNYADLSHTTYPKLSKIVFAIFMVLVPILLLNMLIAMMGNTYAHVIEQSEKEWVKQWAKIVVSLERAVSQKDAQNYLQEYSIKLGPGDDPNNPASEQRGVLVIKSKSKTKARQRKGAVSNWKRVGKVTINELRRRGMTGEELRRIMWGRVSVSTPVIVSPRAAEAKVSAVTAGFGDALTAALDVMAFAHDLDLTAATGSVPTNVDAGRTEPAIGGNDRQRSSASVPPSRKPFAEAADRRGDDRGDLDRKSSGPVNVQGMNFRDACHPDAAEDFQDPLLELVIASENTSDPETLLDIARRAAARFDVTINSNINRDIFERFTMTKIPVEERATVTKRQYFVESSDNDFAGDNLLGAEARLRRIKSANNRLIATRRRPGRVDDDPSSTSTSGSVDGDPGYEPLLNGPERKPSNRQIESRDAPAGTIGSPEKEIGSCDSSKAKAQKRRPKTARNRVSPKETEVTSPRGSESIERNKAISPPTSPADPLEPWSTLGIKDMNSILAWEENLPDSP